MNRAEYLKKVEEVITRTGDASGMGETAPVVAMFLAGFEPVLPPAASPDNMTSLEIAQALEDTCSLTTSDVAAVMVRLGYRLNVNDYRGLEWAMRAVAGD